MTQLQFARCIRVLVAGLDEEARPLLALIWLKISGLDDGDDGEPSTAELLVNDTARSDSGSERSNKKNDGTPTALGTHRVRAVCFSRPAASA